MTAGSVYWPASATSWACSTPWPCFPPPPVSQIADAAGLTSGTSASGSARWSRELRAGRPDGRAPTSLPGARAVPHGHGRPDNLARMTRYRRPHRPSQPGWSTPSAAAAGCPTTPTPDFHHLQAADSATVHDASLARHDHSAGRRHRPPRRGIAVADIGCGSGHAINLLAAAFPAQHRSSATTSPRRPSRRRVRGDPLRADQRLVRAARCRRLRRTDAFDLMTTFDASTTRPTRPWYWPTSPERSARVAPS